MEGDQQINAAKEVVGKTLSVRQTEDLVRKLQQKQDAPAKQPAKPDPLLKDISESLSGRLNSKVTISENAAGKEKLPSVTTIAKI